MKTVFLSASELAKLTKDNKYEDPEKTLNGILKKNGLSDVYVPKSNVEESLSKLSPDKLKEIKKELSLPETANKKDIEDAVKQTIMKKSLKADITEDKSKKKIDKKIADKPVLAAALETGIKKDLMMRRGKVDGIVDDVIVETKNRAKRLFHRIPNYEKVQLEAYMFLTEMDKAIHIECYNEEQNKTDYNHDAEFWEDRVAKIIAYVEENIAPLIK